MATVDMATGLNSGLHPSRHGATNVPYVVSVNVDIADVVTAKGSALAAADVINVIDVPKNTVVLAGGVELVTPFTATTTTVDFGSGVDEDAFVDGFDAQGGDAGAYGTYGAGVPLVVGDTADTLDLTLATLTGTLSAGEIRCFAVFVNVDETKNPGLVKIGS